MSGKCRYCGSTNIEIDPSRGDAVCTDCGVVLEDQLIVSETAFEETSSGNMMMLGQFVSNESSGGATGFGAGYLMNTKESREITIQNARKGIMYLCTQLHLNQHCVDTSVNFYKMALSRQLTRGRKKEHNFAACVYITCRTEGTAHMLIDISDVLQICVHELGRTYLRFTKALCINIPSMDPCLYIMRFASKLEFADKTHEVSMTALRVVQRMKRDSIHSGRKPAGLCGAALLIASRLHDFNRSPGDIIKIVKVHETTLRKRLIEFGDTPSSALTLDEFMSVDLEEEQDPPAFKAARKKDRERLQKVHNMAVEFSDLQAEIDRQLEEHKHAKSKVNSRLAALTEENDADRFVREENLNVIRQCVDDGLDCSREKESPPIVGLGPNIASMGLAAAIHGKENTVDDKQSPNFETFENVNGEVDITDLDDEEIDSYIMSEKEAQFKTNLWNKVNAKYLEEQKEKEEKRQKEIEEGKPEKKRRRVSRKKNQCPANSAGEAIEKMLQEKRISSKINYEVLKSLNVGIVSSEQKSQEDNAADKLLSPEKPPRKESRPSFIQNGFTSPLKARQIESPRKLANSKDITSRKRTMSNHSDVEAEAVPVADHFNASYESDNMENADDYEEDAEPEPTEMSVGQMLGCRDEDDYDYAYEEEEY